MRFVVKKPSQWTIFWDLFIHPSWMTFHNSEKLISRMKCLWLTKITWSIENLGTNRIWNSGLWKLPIKTFNIFAIEIPKILGLRDIWRVSHCYWWDKKYRTILIFHQQQMQTKSADIIIFFKEYKTYIDEVKQVQSMFKTADTNSEPIILGLTKSSRKGQTTGIKKSINNSKFFRWFFIGCLVSGSKLWNLSRWHW